MALETSIYPAFAQAILSVVPLFSVGDVHSWDYKDPNAGTLGADGSLGTHTTVPGSILRRADLDKASASFVISQAFNADWIFFGAKAVNIKARGVLYKASINRAFRVSGAVETDLEMCIAPLEACDMPT